MTPTTPKPQPRNCSKRRPRFTSRWQSAAVKAKPGPKVGSKRAPKVNGTSPELDRALATLMKTPNAALSGGE